MLIELKSEWTDPRDAMKYAAGTVVDVSERFGNEILLAQAGAVVDPALFAQRENDIDTLKRIGIMFEVHTMENTAGGIERGYVIADYRGFEPRFAGRGMKWTTAKPADVFDGINDALSAYKNKDNTPDTPAPVKAQEAAADQPAVELAAEAGEEAIETQPRRTGPGRPKKQESK
jgi:hypothetical protein